MKARVSFGIGWGYTRKRLLDEERKEVRTEKNVEGVELGECLEVTITLLDDNMTEHRAGGDSLHVK